MCSSTPLFSADSLASPEPKAMQPLDYQRTIVAYHGCDESLVHRVLMTGETLDLSENDYDWLGTAPQTR